MYLIAGKRRIDVRDPCENAALEIFEVGEPVFLQFEQGVS